MRDQATFDGSGIRIDPGPGADVPGGTRGERSIRRGIAVDAGIRGTVHDLTGLKCCLEYASRPA